MNAKPDEVLAQLLDFRNKIMQAELERIQGAPTMTISQAREALKQV